MSDSDSGIPGNWDDVRQRALRDDSSSEADPIPAGWQGMAASPLGEDRAASDNGAGADEAHADGGEAEVADLASAAPAGEPEVVPEPPPLSWRDLCVALAPGLRRGAGEPLAEGGAPEAIGGEGEDEVQLAPAGLQLALARGALFPPELPPQRADEQAASLFVDAEFVNAANTLASALAASGSSSSAAHDSENSSIVKHCLIEGGLTLTLAAEARMHCIDETKLRSMQREMAMTAVVFERSHAVAIGNIVTAAFSQPGSRLLTYTEFARYDETPLKFRVKGERPPDLEQMAVAVRLPGAVSAVVPGDSLPSKMLNTETGMTLLVERANTFFCIEFRFVHWLQAMQSTTAECYYTAVQESRLPMRGVAGKFERRQRITTTDGDSAIEKCEAHIAARDPGLASMRCKCEVHKAAGMRRKVMAVHDVVIRFLLHVSLAIGFSSAMNVMRQELRGILRESVEFRRGVPPPGHRADLVSLLDVFAHMDVRTVKLRRAIVEALFIGPLVGDKVVHYCSGCCDGPNDCLLKFLVYGVQALCGRAPAPFPRHRWTRQEESVMFVGLFEGLNRLFSRTFERFCYRVGVRLKRAVREQGWDQRTLAIEDAVQAGEGDGQEERAAPGAALGHARAAGGTWQAKQLQQSNSRRIVLGMLSSGSDGPLGEVVVLANVLEPQRKFMGSLLLLGGQQWAHDEACNAAVSLLRQGVSEVRAYRGLVAASCQIEEELIGSVKARMSQAQFWACIPPHLRTWRLRNSAFKGLSMVMCLAVLLRDEHRGYPFKIFSLLLRPDSQELVDEIMGDGHLWCLWSKRFVEHWRTRGGLTCSAALMDIRVALILGVFDTSAIESKHVAIRRVLVALSNQAAAPSLSVVSALEALRLFRKCAKAVAPLLYPEAASVQGDGRTDAGTPALEDADPEGGAGAQGAGYGGAWRCFLSDNKGSGPLDFGVLKERFAPIKERGGEEYESLVERGRQATELRKRGLGGMGQR